MLVEDHRNGDDVPQATLQSRVVSSVNRYRSEATREQTPRQTDRPILSQRRLSAASVAADADVPTGKYHSYRPQSSKRHTVSVA